MKEIIDSGLPTESHLQPLPNHIREWREHRRDWMHKRKSKGGFVAEEQEGVVEVFFFVSQRSRESR